MVEFPKTNDAELDGYTEEAIKAAVTLADCMAKVDRHNFLAGLLFRTAIIRLLADTRALEAQLIARAEERERCNHAWMRHQETGYSYDVCSNCGELGAREPDEIDID